MSLLARYGGFVFRWRNLMFPVAMAAFLAASLAAGECDGERALGYALGLLAAGAGQAFRVLVVGLAYIKRGGVDRRVYAAELVTEGMFAHCRNPLYLGNLVVAAGLLALTGDPLALGAGGAFFVTAYAAMVATEERYLEGRFGARYDVYRARVPRWLPDLRGLGATLRSMDFDWRRVIAKEYPTLTTTVVSACAIVALRELGCTGASTPVPAAAAVIAAGAIVTAVAVRGLKKRGRLRESSA